MIVNFLSPLAKAGIFQCIVVEWTKSYLLYLHETPAHNAIVPTYLDIDATLQPIPLFVLYTRHPPSSSALCDPGERQTSSHPRNWVTAAGRWGANQTMWLCTGGSLWPDRHGFTRATSISPRIIAPPPPSYIPKPCNDTNRPKGL